MWLIVYSNDHAPLTVMPIYSSSKLRTAQMMIFSLAAMIGLEKCCITSACLQWLCHSGERTVARGPLVLFFCFCCVFWLVCCCCCCCCCCCFFRYQLKYVRKIKHDTCTYPDKDVSNRVVWNSKPQINVFPRNLMSCCQHALNTRVFFLEAGSEGSEQNACIHRLDSPRCSHMRRKPLYPNQHSTGLMWRG